jgi:hypothetical protein
LIFPRSLSVMIREMISLRIYKEEYILNFLIGYMFERIYTFFCDIREVHYYIYRKSTLLILPIEQYNFHIRF